MASPLRTLFAFYILIVAGPFSHVNSEPTIWTPAGEVVSSGYLTFPLPAGGFGFRDLDRALQLRYHGDSADFEYADSFF